MRIHNNPSAPPYLLNGKEEMAISAVSKVIGTLSFQDHETIGESREISIDELSVEELLRASPLFLEILLS